MILFDEETGEVITPKENEYIKIHNTSDEQNFKLIKTYNHIPFYTFKHSSINILINTDLKLQHYKMLFKMISLLPFGSQIVQINGINSCKEEVARYFGIEIKTFSNHIRKLIKTELVSKIKSGRKVNYCINPYFICYGNKPNLEMLKMFYNTVWNTKSNKKIMGTFNK